ncbi:MAG: hypothetical protein KAH57_07435 [Thermoplasmata archaeon]|nr:hypothetical protein [Thermoplasmata archaeon]
MNDPGDMESGRMENIKKNNKIFSAITYYSSIIVLFALLVPLNWLITQSLMGYDMTAIVLGLSGAIGIAMILLVISQNKHRLLLLSMISTAYSFMIGAIYFHFLPTMEDMARSYGPVEENRIFSGNHGFDPSTVDLVFYDRLLLIVMIFFLLVAFISGIGFIRDNILEKRTKFKIVEH